MDALFELIRQKFYTLLIMAFIVGNWLWIFFVNFIAFITPFDTNEIEWLFRPWGFTTWAVIEREYWTPVPERNGQPIFDGLDLFTDFFFTPGGVL